MCKCIHLFLRSNQPYMLVNLHTGSCCTVWYLTHVIMILLHHRNFIIVKRSTNIHSQSNPIHIIYVYIYYLRLIKITKWKCYYLHFFYWTSFFLYYKTPKWHLWNNLMNIFNLTLFYIKSFIQHTCFSYQELYFHHY